MVTDHHTQNHSSVRPPCRWKVGSSSRNSVALQDSQHSRCGRRSPFSHADILTVDLQFVVSGLQRLGLRFISYFSVFLFFLFKTRPHLLQLFKEKAPRQQNLTRASTLNSLSPCFLDEVFCYFGIIFVIISNQLFFFLHGNLIMNCGCQINLIHLKKKKKKSRL